jgi:dGTPase
VFVFHEGDHFRTRLTHTLEVTQIARALARALSLDEDLAEALALAHDLGHPPFGHAGERALDRCLTGCGGFDHNAQTLRVVTELEARYAGFDGLNLCWETLEGLLKHNGPLIRRDGSPAARYLNHGVPYTILEYAKHHDIPLWTYASAEAQVAAIADDIAYDAHDIDDGLRAGLFVVDELAELPLIGEIGTELASEHGSIEPNRLVHELVRQLITRMIEDVIAEAKSRLAALSPRSTEEIRQAKASVAAFSTAMAEADEQIKTFLFHRMYRDARVMRVMGDAERVVYELFERYEAEPAVAPSDWAETIITGDVASRARRIADLVAGMTDRYALAEHSRLFDSTPELR